MGHFFNEVFTFGRSVFNFKIGVGIEEEDELKVNDKNATAFELYSGTFKRIMATYPIDVFWIWTNEGWTPRNDETIKVEDVEIAGVVEDMLAAYVGERARL